MTEKVLPYDRSIAPQETGFWCGPASTQMILNSRGLFFSEQDLANRMGTTVNGTDYIGQITAVLNGFLGGGYVIRGIPNDPPTGGQVELLWSDLVASVEGGFGVSANIVAPPGNYPRGTMGSVSPAYAGGTVYHYVALMGYYEGLDGRHVWVADSGFRPFGYWCSLGQVASLIAGKGYTAKPVGSAEAFTAADSINLAQLGPC